MKTPAVKGLFAAAAAVVLALTPLVGQCVTIDVAKFQQRYPWNGLVDIDYTITREQGESELDPAKHSVEITVVNCGVAPAVTNVAHVFRQGALPISDGAHRVTWDANAEGINFNSQNVKVFAEIVHYAEKYMVIDVSGGPNATEYPVTYYNGAPEGGFNTEEYKGNKIALRLIPPGSFVMGSPTAEPGRANTAAREVQHAVAITTPFYIGVFEITQKQYLKVMGDNPSTYKSGGDYHPVETVLYNDIRGSSEGAKWPQTNSVDAASFMGRLRAKCKEWDPDKGAYAKDVDGLFDLPTDAQWEYACRAGTTTPLNDGGTCPDIPTLEQRLTKLGRYTKNNGGSQHTVVGTYAPNAWGLYDMHGNVCEWCIDWYREAVQNIENPSVDPVGGISSDPSGTDPVRVTRGGSYSFEAKNCRSAYRGSGKLTKGYGDLGFRLSRTLP